MQVFTQTLYEQKTNHLPGAFCDAPVGYRCPECGQSGRSHSFCDRCSPTTEADHDSSHGSPED